MTTTLNSSYLSNPVSVSQGGSGVATNTAYGLLLGGTSTTNPIQQAGTGTSNQGYVSGGSAAIGTWTNNDALGTWQLISSQAASNSATIDFTGLSSSYEAYKILAYNIIPQTAGAHLILRVSSDNGANYSAGATDYFFSLYAEKDATGTLVFNTNGSVIRFTYQGVSTTAAANFWEITFVEPNTSLAQNGVYYQGKYRDNSNGTLTIVGQGRYNGTQATNAIRLSFGSGNIVSGTFNLYALLV